MHTNFISYTVIGFLTLNILFQIKISVCYNWKFVLQYLNNEKSSWNPNIDRIKLTASIVLTLFSLYLLKSLIKREALFFEIIIIIIAVLVSLGLIYFVINKTEVNNTQTEVNNTQIEENNPQTDENNTKNEVIEKLKFKLLEESSLQELVNKLNNENRAIINYSELLSISKGINLEKKSDGLIE